MLSSTGFEGNIYVDHERYHKGK